MKILLLKGLTVCLFLGFLSSAYAADRVVMLEFAYAGY